MRQRPSTRRAPCPGRSGNDGPAAQDQRGGAPAKLRGRGGRPSRGLGATSTCVPSTSRADATCDLESDGDDDPHHGRTPSIGSSHTHRTSRAGLPGGPCGGSHRRATTATVATVVAVRATGAAEQCGAAHADVVRFPSQSPSSSASVAARALASGSGQSHELPPGDALRCRTGSGHSSPTRASRGHSFDRSTQQFYPRSTLQTAAIGPGRGLGAIATCAPSTSRC